MMQVMMYAVALYAGDAMGISEGPQRFLQWISLIVTTPVLLYSGRVFYTSAWRSVSHRRVGMDVPVALGHFHCIYHELYQFSDRKWSRIL